MPANHGYDVVVDVDAEGDLGHTDLQEDLEFHNSNFDAPGNRTGGSTNKIHPDRSAANPFLSSSGGIGSGSGSTSRQKRIIFQLSFYAQFFDVDTAEVLRRCLATLYPRSSFLDVLDGNPDLYGPFWIATTVVFILFLAGTMNWRLGGHGAEAAAPRYDWGLLSGSAGLIYGYTGVVPVGLFFVLRWFGSESANLLECWCLYGYANLIWIPVALISWSTMTALNYVFVGLGLALSVAFLLRNLYPVLSATDVKTSKILLVGVVLLHTGLAVAIKVLFFAHGSPALKNKQPPPTNEAPTDGAGAGRRAFMYN